MDFIDPEVDGLYDSSGVLLPDSVVTMGSIKAITATSATALVFASDFDNIDAYDRPYKLLAINEVNVAAVLSKDGWDNPSTDACTGGGGGEERPTSGILYP